MSLAHQNWAMVGNQLALATLSPRLPLAPAEGCSIWSTQPPWCVAGTHQLWVTVAIDRQTLSASLCKLVMCVVLLRWLGASGICKHHNKVCELYSYQPLPDIKTKPYTLASWASRFGPPGSCPGWALCLWTSWGCSQLTHSNSKPTTPLCNKQSMVGVFWDRYLLTFCVFIRLIFWSELISSPQTDYESKLCLFLTQTGWQNVSST